MSVGGNAVRSFSDLQSALAERVEAGDEELDEDISTILGTARKYWGGQKWEDALKSTSWKTWAASEASILHDEGRVGGWIEKLAAALNLTGPDAQKIALLCNPFYASQVGREGSDAQFAASPLTRQVTLFYYHERLARIYCKCHLLESVSQEAQPRESLHNRAEVMQALTGEAPLPITPVGRTDIFRAERERQKCVEHSALLHYLMCLSYYFKPPDVSQLLKELSDMLAQNPNSLLMTYHKCRSQGVMMPGSRLRAVFTSWIAFVLASLYPLQQPLQTLLPPHVYKFLVEVEGPESHLIRLLMMCLDSSIAGPPTHCTIAQGLSMLLYIVTGRHTLPPGFVESEPLPELDQRRFSFMADPVKHLARKVLHIVTSVVPPKRSSETVLLVMTRVALASKREDEVTSIPDDYSGGVSLLQEISRTAGWLFPSCLSTTALFELITACPPNHQDDWWSCLRFIDKTAIPYPFDQQISEHLDRSQRILADLPDDATIHEIISLPTERERTKYDRVPVKLGTWFAPMAPIPGSKPAEEAESRIRQRLEGSNATTQQIFAVWKLPEDKSFNGWMWMCIRCLHILQLSHRVDPQTDKWLVPYLELVNSIIPLFHSMICGPSSDPDDELMHFSNIGHQRLQEIESYLQEIQKVLDSSFQSTWSLVWLLTEVLANLVEWQEAKCYTQRAALVKRCSTTLKCLLRLSRTRAVFAYNVTESVMSSLRCLFHPGKQTSRSPLLHLFWVVEAANKRCSCTYGVVSLLKEILSSPNEYVYFRGDLLEIASYVCEVFTDLSNQWYHCVDEQWRLTYDCLHTIMAVIKQTRLQRAATKGPKQVQTPAIHHLIHHNRMGRALAETLGRVCNAIYDPDQADKGPSPVLANKVLLLALQLTEYGLEACEETIKQGQPMPTLGTLLCETETGVHINAGDSFTIPALTFHVAAYGPDDLTRIQACRTFGLLCTVAQSGSLLRHVGYRAVSTGKKILTDIDPASPSGAWTRTTFESSDPQMQQAYKHGIMHPDTTTAQMPHIFRSRAEVQMVWEDASLGTMRLLSIIRLMTDMVTHQPQLFLQAFMNQGQMSDPLGNLVRNFVYEEGPSSECRHTVREAVVALFVAALQSKEPCRSVVLARTVPTLSIKITADAPGLGDRLAGEDGRGCPWHSMPLVKQEDFSKLTELLKQAVEGDVPCVQFDRSRSWTQCGFTKRNKDVVDAPMALTVGPLKSQPSAGLRTPILQEAAAVAKKAMEAVGIKDVSVYASWYLSKPVHDPEVWPILAEALAACRFSIGEWMADDEELGKTERAGDMSWWIFTAGHILRSMAVVSSLYLLYPPHKYASENARTVNPEEFETSELVGAVRKCIERVLGKWGDQSEGEMAGVLGMMVPLKYSESLTIDGLLGQAAGLFYGSVAVPTMHHPRTVLTPRKRLSSSTRPTPSPRKSALGDKSPKMVSPLIRPAFADTPGSNEQHLLASVDCASLFPSTPFDTPGVQTVQEQELSVEGSPERVTLYEMLRKAEVAVHNTLRDTGVVEDLAPPMTQYANQLIVSMLRGRAGGNRALSDGVAPCATVKMPGAFIDMETIKAMYPRYMVLTRVCQELNDVVGLAAAAYYMLTSTSQLISLLLKSSSVCSSTQKKLKMLPTNAILDPSDWRQGTNTRTSLVYIILKRCLLHPPHDTAGQDQEPDPSPLVSLLDSHIRSEACKVLTDMIAEVSSRATLVREGKLDSSEKPYASPQDVHTVNRHIIWNVYSVLQSMHATKDEGTVMGNSRMGNSRVGEADLILCLCLLGSRNDGARSFKSDNDGDTAAVASALFPHLHQYLCMDNLEHAEQADLDCYKAAFVALCTFGVPSGEERHAVQVARTLLNHLRRLHSSLQDELARQKLVLEVGTSSNTSSITVQHIVDRVLLILKGLRSMAASPMGIEVFAEAEVLPFLSSLRLFMPPSPDAISPYTPDREKQVLQPWHTLWQALLDTVSAAAIPPPVDGRRKETSKAFAAQVYAFTEKLSPRIRWLLSDQGLQCSISDETVRSLQLVSCVTRSKIANGTHLSVRSPSVPWIPELHNSLTYIKDCLNSKDGTSETGPPLLGSFGARQTNTTSTPTLDFKRQALYFDAASQIMSILRLHLVAFLPVSAPVGSLGKASPPVKRLLETLELAMETKGRDFTTKINEVCEGAFRAPEACIGKMLKESGYPFTRLQVSQIRRLKEAIFVECASYWAPSASSAAKELYTMHAQQGDVVEAFEDIVVFGAADDLTKPAKRLIELTEGVADCLARLLEASGGGKKKDLQVSSAVKAAACAIEHAALLRGVYTGCLELLAPVESQLLWAGNVTQRLLGERSGVHMRAMPGTVLLKRVAAPLTHLIQCNNVEELRKARAALALHCIDEMCRQPDPTPWLTRTCHTLQGAVSKAPKNLGSLINSTIQLLRKLTKEQSNADISLVEGK